MNSYEIRMCSATRYKGSSMWLGLAVLTVLFARCTKQPEKKPAIPEEVAAKPIAPPVPAPPPPKRYVATKISKPIKLDGKLDEPAWRSAPSTGPFVDPLTGNPGALVSEAKLLWDAKNLYVGFENVDGDVWGELTGRDAKLWTQDAVEVMIDADCNGRGYVDLQVAPNGTLFDAFPPTYRKYEELDPSTKPFRWNSKAKVSVRIDGTLNRRDDQDKGWSAEIAIPLADANGLEQEGVRIPPAVADLWHVNFFRLDSAKGPIAVAWSASMVDDFRRLEGFGELVFGNEDGEYPPPWAGAERATEAEAEAFR